MIMVFAHSFACIYILSKQSAPAQYVFIQQTQPWLILLIFFKHLHVI